MGDLVVVLVCVLLCVVDERARIGSHVSAANDLDTESETLVSGDLEVLLERVLCALKVGLVCVVENDVAVRVELFLELHAKTEDAPLVVLGFGVNEDVCTPVLGCLGDFVACVDELLGELAIIVEGFADARSSASESKEIC